MKLLIIALIALAAPAPALANGSPCGAPPKLESAEAARAIDAAVRADLGAAPVETPFLDRARQSVDELARTYGVSRADVVARYVFHFCEALYARGTDGQQLSQLIARVEDALDQPAPDKQAERDRAPGGVDGGASERKAAAPAVGGPTEPTAEAMPDTLDTPDAEPNPAQQPAIRPFQYRATPKRRPDDLGMGQFGAPQKKGVIVQAQPNGAVQIDDPEAPSVTGEPQSPPPVAATEAPPAVAAPEAPALMQPTPPAKDDAAGPETAGQPSSRPGIAKAPSTLSAPAEDNGAAAPEPAPAPSPDQPRVAATEPMEPPEGETPAQITGAAPAVGEAQQPDRPTPPSEDESEVAARAPSAQSETTAPAQDRETAASEAARAPQAAASVTPDARAPADQGACPDRGVLGPECFDVDAALERLRDRPVEYNHPEEMIKGQATEISLVLRTDFTEKGLPEETSEAFEGLQGEVKQQRAAIANIMSARLRGRDFEVDPKGMQERTVTWRRPVEWSWYVTPKSGGDDKRLELELYAHIVNPQGETQPPVLIKTLDATIDVDVRTLDWLIEQARTFEPLYAVAAAIIGLLTALFTLWLRRRPAHLGDGPPSGITTSPTPPQRRVSDMSASEAAAEAARKGQEDADKGNGRA